MTSLNPLHRIGRQVAEAITLHRRLPRAALRARVIEVLTQAGFPDAEHRLDAFPHQLSGGQRQRVMIAMALANDPALLIADEPTTALDVTIQAQILELLAKLKAERSLALLLITHDLQIVRRYADRVCVMQGGKIVEAGRVADVFAAPAASLYAHAAGGGAQGRARRRCRTTRRPCSRPTTCACISQFAAACCGASSARCARSMAFPSRCAPARPWAWWASPAPARPPWAWPRCGWSSAQGRVRFDGVDIATLDRRALRRLRARAQIVFQDPFGSLSPRLSGGRHRRRGAARARTLAVAGRARGARRRGTGRSRAAGRRRRALSARVQRRPAAAHRDRPRDGAEAALRRAGRADQRARHVGAGADRRTAAAAAAGSRLGVSVHQPRFESRARAGAPDRRAARRPRGGAGRGGCRCLRGRGRIIPRR